MAYRYLLSSGQSTERVEEYIMDLVDLHLKVNPGDIPHRDNIGFDFNLSGIMKDKLESELVYRLNALVDNIKSRISGVALGIESINLVSETKVRLVLQINGKLSEGYFFDLYK